MDSRGSAHLLAWRVLPFAVVVLAVVVRVLAPALAPEPTGGGVRFLPGIVAAPEPREQLAYVASVLSVAGFAVVLALAFGLRGRSGAATPGPPPLAQLRLAWLSQGFLAFVVGLAWWVQRDIHVYASTGRVAVSLGLGALAVGVGVRWPAVRRVAALAARRPVLGAGAVVVALALTAAELAYAVFTDDSAGASLQLNWGHFPYTLDELASVVAGRTPGVDYVSQYTFLWPYVAAPVLHVTGVSMGSFSALMAAGSAVAYLAVLVTLRQLTGRWLAAVALYVPVLGLSSLAVERLGPDVAGNTAYYAVMPLRYLGPLLLALACARAIGRPSVRRHGLVGLLAGLVALNNVEFGVPALLAGAVALCCGLAPEALPRRRLKATGRVLAAYAGGVAGAAVGVLALVLVRTGSLLDLGVMTLYARVFGLGGHFLLPIPPALGLMAVVWLTFAAAVLAGMLPALLGRAPEDVRARSATAMCGFAGVFGFGTLTYYVGRSHPYVLVAIFPAWGFALAVLAVVLTRALGDAGSRRLAIVPAALVAGHLVLGVALLSLDGVFAQPARISAQSAPGAFTPRAMRGFVERCTRPGERVAIVAPLAQRTAFETGVRNVFPFAHPAAVISEEQVERVREAYDEAGVTKVFAGDQPPQLTEDLRAVGFTPAQTQVDEDPQPAGVGPGATLTLYTRRDATCQGRPAG